MNLVESTNEVMRALQKYGFLTNMELLMILQENEKKDIDDALMYGFISFQYKEVIYGEVFASENTQGEFKATSLTHRLFVYPNDPIDDPFMDELGMSKLNRVHPFESKSYYNFFHPDKEVLKLIKDKVCELSEGMRDQEDTNAFENFLHVWQPVIALLKKNERRKEKDE